MGHHQAFHYEPTIQKAAYIFGIPLAIKINISTALHNFGS
jgi:hypothetical protein